MKWPVFIESIPAPNGPRCHMLTRACVVAGGIMFAGIVWEDHGTKTKVTECLIVWFAMIPPYCDVLLDLMEVSP